MTECSVFFQNSHCMSEYSVFLKIFIVRSSALCSRNSHCTTEYNKSFHISTTRLSVVHFHAIHYTTESNVFFESALCIVFLEIVCILFCRNLSSKQRQREGNCRHPISGQLDVDATKNSYDEKITNRFRIFEIGISLRA